MAKSSADDDELRKACEAVIEGTKQKIVMSIRVSKSQGIWGKSGKLGRQMAKPRPAKLYKLKHLSKVEVITHDPSGCTFTLGFDNLRSQRVAPPQWTMRNTDDRNRLIFCVLNICKDVLGRLPKVVGIDVVEMALWAKENTPIVTKQRNLQDGPVATKVAESDLKVSVERELISQADEQDMEALLDNFAFFFFSFSFPARLTFSNARFYYVMCIGKAEAFSERLKRELHALEAANVHAILENEPLIEEVLQGLEAATNCVDDMDEELGIFNMKHRHMREDIESIETRNNKLEMQSVNNKLLIEELDKLLEWLHVPSEHAACLTGGSFDEAQMLQNIEACEWLTGALHGLQVPNLDPTYANMRAVKEKRAELEKLKTTFVRRASEFLRNYFTSLMDFMISDKSYFSQRGQLKRPDHADLRYKCRTYARLLQHLKAREFANELHASTKASRNPTVWLEASTGSNQSAHTADTSSVSDAYAKMLTIFIPLLVDEEDFYAVVDWAYKIDPLRCMSMHGITERYLFGQKADAAGFVRLLLGDLESRISMQFGRFVGEACHQIERNERNVRQMGVLSYIPRFATHMEQYIQGQSRDLVDQAYTKFVSIMFVTLEKIAQTDLKYADIFLLENYAAFQNSLYDLANVVPTLAKFYHQTSEAYEHACTRHISMIIYYQFERLFEFAHKIEDLMYTITPEEIAFQLGLSKMDLRKMLKASLSGVDKSISAMYKKLQKNLTSEELLPSLWDKCKEFLDKYESFAQLVAKIYPNETILSVTEMRDLLASIECWASYITTSINNDSLWCLSLRCPEPSCKASVGQDMIDSLVSEEDRKKYSEFLFKSYIEENGSTKWCPGPGCHRPLDCETVKKWVLKNTSESENMNYILAYCKPCPNYFGSRSKKIEMAKQSLEKCTHYFERWDVNKKSKVKAIADFQKVKNEKFKQLSKNLDISEACFDFITKAWLQIVECRGILEWSYAYRYYLPDNGPAKKHFFEFLQGEAESWLEKLHNCVERELQPFLYYENQLKHFDDYRRNLIQLAIVTENYFEKLVKALENGLSDVHKASSSSSKDIFEDDYWFCDCCIYANPFSVNKCQMCTSDDYEGA
ncbi:hypothetical protein GH714_015037 [Hevea brasiliensis]|uniref:RING-type domain-containing protein n=1 Tax=Hevea brasiliensis TaxID=3981 RepID=A0A6A6K6R0_HEVBR|nr:hypothetical protein GH714_015037 [Hevea brasiliensis]